MRRDYEAKAEINYQVPYFPRAEFTSLYSWYMKLECVNCVEMPTTRVPLEAA
jgi:hypothetical protein